jgi:DNA processing protein
LDSREGIGSIRPDSIKGFKDFKRAEEDINFIEKYKITPLFLTDKA